MSFCEVCEAKFLLLLEMNKYIGRGVRSASNMGRCEDRDFSLTLLTRMLTGPSEGVSGEGRARRGESVIIVKKIDVHVNATGVSRGRCQKP